MNLDSLSDLVKNQNIMPRLLGWLEDNPWLMPQATQGQVVGQRRSIVIIIIYFKCSKILSNNR